MGLYHLAWEVDTLSELVRIRGLLIDRGALTGAYARRPTRRGSCRLRSCAAAIVHGRCGEHEYSDEVVADPQVQAVDAVHWIENDTLGRDFRGDPASAMLEILDVSKSYHGIAAVRSLNAGLMSQNFTAGPLP